MHLYIECQLSGVILAFYLLLLHVVLAITLTKPREMGGRGGSLMFNALDSGSSRPGLSPGRGTALCSWARHFSLIPGS